MKKVKINRVKLSSFLDKYSEEDNRTPLSLILESEADMVIAAIEEKGVTKSHVINGLIAATGEGSFSGWNSAIGVMLKKRGLRYVGRPVPNIERTGRARNASRAGSNKSSLRDDVTDDL